MKLAIFFTTFTLLLTLLLILNNQEINNQNTDNNYLTIPIDAYILTSDKKQYTSERTNNNIMILFDKVNNVWSSANISADIQKINLVKIDDDVSFADARSIALYMVNNGFYDPNRINAYFAKYIGANGIAMPGNIILVADETTVFDYRATSHEIGHVLELGHVFPINRLMAQGVNGLMLTEEEIKVSRSNAKKFQ